MRKEFQHIILTRFNLPSSDYSEGRNVSHDWLSERFRLFERYCFGSVKGQSCGDFLWFVLFDEATPAEFKERIAEYSKESFFRAIFLNQSQTENLYHELNLLIHKELEQKQLNPNFILTTRLDNDDALHREFVERVQAEFAGLEHEALIDFERGLQLVEQREVLKSHEFRFSHFTTLAESFSGEIETVLSFPHDSVPSGVAVHLGRLRTPMWLEVIHGGNVSNSVSFKPKSLLQDLFFMPIKSRKVLADFSIEGATKFWSFGRFRLLFEWISSKIKRG